MIGRTPGRVVLAGAAAVLTAVVIAAVVLLGDGPFPLGRTGPKLVTVQPSVETELFPGASGDVADDAAIWRHPTHPERSLVLADDKSDTGGVAVYDLDGRLRTYQRTGRIGNIDLRDDVRVADRTVTLVGANDRSDDTVRFWSLDHETGALESLDDGTLASPPDNYGFCLGRSTDGATLYAVVTAKAEGTFEQYSIATASGKVRISSVRTVSIGSQSEGCAVDDRTGALYVGEEDVGLWRYDLDPSSGSQRTAVDTVGEAGHLTADVEGVALSRGPTGAGVLVVSCQGDSTYAMYDLDGTNAYLGSFRIAPTDGGDIDATSATDGLAVAAGDFGPRFPDGLLVVHDAENLTPGGEPAAASNLKFVRFDRVRSPATATSSPAPR